MHRELLPRADADRLHTPRKNSGRGTVSVEHYAQMTTESVKKIVESRNERLANSFHEKDF